MRAICARAVQVVEAFEALCGELGDTLASDGVLPMFETDGVLEIASTYRWWQDTGMVAVCLEYGRTGDVGRCVAGIDAALDQCRRARGIPALCGVSMLEVAVSMAVFQASMEFIRELEEFRCDLVGANQQETIDGHAGNSREGQAKGGQQRGGAD